MIRSERGAATAIMAIFLVILTVGGGALITEHVSLTDQRDTLNRAAASASIAAAQRMATMPADLSDDDLDELKALARGYIIANLSHLGGARYTRAVETLQVTVQPHPKAGSVAIIAEADLGGSLFAIHLPLLASYRPPDRIRGIAGVKCSSEVVEVALALDVSASMNREDFGGQRRITAAVDAARQLLDTLEDNGCQTPVAVGLVPWAGTVRAPEVTVEQWRLVVDMTSYQGNELWTGCPVRPDFEGQPRPRTAETLDLRDLQSIAAGPNDGCVMAGMIPLSPDTSAVAEALDEMRDGLPQAWDTMGHLGITWARRMLSSNWQADWQSADHPVQPGDGVLKLVVLLTDGLSRALSATDRPTADAWLDDMLLEACSRAARDGIEVYVVSLLPVGHQDAKAIGQLLSDCVGGAAERTFAADDEKSLRRAFATIAERLVEVRRTL